VLGAYALLLLLFSAYLASSPREGTLLGLFAVIGELAMDFIYSILVAGVMIPLVPYAVGLTLFFGRIAVFPFMGSIGGYLGQQYFAEKTKRRLRVKKRV
jgi:CHASE2 domain-containing sensor protein